MCAALSAMGRAVRILLTVCMCVQFIQHKLQFGVFGAASAAADIHIGA